MSGEINFRTIGFHASANTSITFLEDQTPGVTNRIRAHIPSLPNPIAVQLPDIKFPGNFINIPAADQVNRLLNNRHFQPVYLPAQEEKPAEVSFLCVEPDNKTWEEYARFNLPEDETVWITRSDGTISYVFVNTVTTWNWRNNTLTHISFKTQNITVLAELPDGKLLAGDDAGNLYFEGEEQPVGFNLNKGISEIVPINNVHYLISSDDAVIIINIHLKKIIHRWDPSQPIVLRNSTIVLLNNGKLEVWKYNYERDIYEQIEHILKEKIWASHMVYCIKSKTSVVLASIINEKDPVILFNIEENSYEEFTSLALRRSIFGNRSLVQLNNQLLAYGPQQRNVTIHFKSKDNTFSAESAGSWGVTAVCPLSDGSLMYATSSSPSGIHVVTNKGKKIFSDENITQNKGVDALIELVNGSVVIKFSDKTLSFIQSKKLSADDKNYQIEKCKLEIKYNPERLELYLELAKLYEGDNDNQFRTYLAGLEVAIKGNNIYQARRLYEKARKIKPEDAELYHLFLFYLEKTPYEIQRRQVILDLSRLPGNPVSAALQEKKCRKRLFIGEGDFSYTESLIKKHKDTHKSLSKAITATELLKPAGAEIKTRVSNLQQEGVMVLFGIDGRDIPLNFGNRRIKRIQWNCPFGGTDTQERTKFKTVIPRFFLSCSQVQLPKDRVHVTLVQGSEDYWKVRQQENPIVLGATSAGYRLIRKRMFGSQRYPEYKHVKTGKTKEYTSGGEEREFIFEKVDMSNLEASGTIQERALSLKNIKEKNYEVKTDREKPEDSDYYFECSTDEDSSDYYDSE